EPQFASSKSRFVHVPPQSAPPFGQVHAPFWHDFPPVQAMPQPPQLLLSSRRLAHDWPSQQAWLENSQHSLPQATSPSIVSQPRPCSVQTPGACPQDLPAWHFFGGRGGRGGRGFRASAPERSSSAHTVNRIAINRKTRRRFMAQIGRASCRERV